MVERIYLFLWVLLILTIGAFFITGTLTPTVEVALGFTTFGLVFMGMIGVLPHWTTQDHHPKH